MSGIEAVAGLVLAIPGVVDLCVKYGRYLLDKYRSFKRCRERLGDIILEFELRWGHLEAEICFFKKIEAQLEGQTKRRFEMLIKTLYEKLQVIRAEIEKISGKEDSFFGRSKFVLLVKKSLEESIAKFSNWHVLLQPMIILFTLTSNLKIDSMIQEESKSANASTAITAVRNLRAVFKEAKEKKSITKDSVHFPATKNFWNGRKTIKYTSIEVHQVPGGQALIIDPIACNGRDTNAREIVYNVRRLAQVLRLVDPMTFGIPACVGLVHVKDSGGMLSKIEMVFEMPAELGNPQSLRSLLLSSNQDNGPQFSVNARIELAKRLARIIVYVHSADFVHKNFRPETVIILDPSNSKNDRMSSEIGFPFLLGFQSIRLASGHTAYLGDSAWEQNIYRHPERQGEYPEQSYKMHHDIYSLGVCLLEIALWKSFVIWDEQGKIPLRSPQSRSLVGRTGWEIKDKLVTMCREMIPRSLGHKYAEVAISCLECLDTPEYLNDDGASVGINYIEKILGNLEDISL